MEEGVPTLSFASTYSVNRRLSFKLNASNLLNSPYRLSRENSVSDDKVILNEFKKGQNISLGISYEF
jgi:outer membrane receptor protein involved in Fe transport